LRLFGIQLLQLVLVKLFPDQLGKNRESQRAEGSSGFKIYKSFYFWHKLIMTELKITCKVDFFRPNESDQGQQKEKTKS
jgi:hypothetical protein